jgi:hypothetical protein
MAGDNGSSKFDPWRIATMVVIVVAFFVGFYLLSGMIDARFDALDAQLRSTSESLATEIQTNRSLISAQAEATPQPVAAEAPAAPAAEPAAAPAEGGEQPAEGGEAPPAE